MIEYKITMPEGWKPEACAKDCPMMEHGCGEFGKCDCPLSHAVPVKDVVPLEETPIKFSDRKKLAFAFSEWADKIRASYVAENVITWGLSLGLINRTKARAYLEGLDVKGGR